MLFRENLMILSKNGGYLIFNKVLLIIIYFFVCYNTISYLIHQLVIFICYNSNNYCNMR